jgi:abnormal spindle-like microcephaly-associated protein
MIFSYLFLTFRRVVELITGSDSLIQKLRVPAVSKLQKIHNVELALKGLAEAGCEIKNLIAKDIVMGHKEKTLSLLWQIIHNYQVIERKKSNKLE